MKKLFLFLLTCIVLQAKPVVSVSIAPQAFFVKKIAGQSVIINTILPQNTDEHNFEFKPSTMKELEKSDIYFTIGLEYEKSYLNKIRQNFPKLKIIDTQENISLLEFEEYDENTPEEEHHEEHNVLDIHTWLDPVLVKIQAQNIYNALTKEYPHNKTMYQENLNTFLNELDHLDAKIQSKFNNKKEKEFIVYHPSWAYFAKRYGLVQIPVEINGTEPKIKELQKLIQKAKTKNIKIIFVQPGFPEDASKVLAKEIDANIVSINHLSEDWHNELLKTADALEKSLK
ncbi:TPA: zinc ABC transporter substrate-binding protein [Campylobacter coli]|uniref:metal ABC transporter solute-binding protein, Zn/Mn family n=1 Tax=Campylobacter coli TaxID=195 RepID=UPI002028C6F2|nr:zinc ABC transporter substrate-binding protein [Campylobacter coli]